MSTEILEILDHEKVSTERFQHIHVVEGRPGARPREGCNAPCGHLWTTPEEENTDRGLHPENPCPVCMERDFLGLTLADCCSQCFRHVT